MEQVALGQYIMVVRPVSVIMHILVYVGFILINIEVLEIIIDGFTGGHRSFAPYLGSFYSFLIGFFEILAFLVLVGVIVFWFRRNVNKIKRFWSREMKGWPFKEGNIFLYFEMVLILAIILLYATDS